MADRYPRMHREEKTVEAMARRYCREQHGAKEETCADD